MNVTHPQYTNDLQLLIKELLAKVSAFGKFLCDTKTCMDQWDIYKCLLPHPVCDTPPIYSAYCAYPVSCDLFGMTAGFL